MPGGVARHIQNLKVQTQRGDVVTFLQPCTRLRHRLGGGAIDAGPGRLPQFGDAAGVIGMMVRD